jgi:hypothetical protein
LILNGIAKTLDLFTHLGLGVEMLSQSLRYRVMTKISVLNWSWVAVSVLHFPFSLLRLEVLVSNITQLNLVGRHNKLCASVPTLWLRLKKCKNWDSTDSPLRWMLDNIFNGNASSIDSSIKECTSSESRSRSKRTVEGSWMGRSSLITEEMRHWSESTTIGLRSLSLLKFFVDEVGNKLLGLELREIDVSAAKLLIVNDLSLHEVGKRDVE